MNLCSIFRGKKLLHSYNTKHYRNLFYTQRSIYTFYENNCNHELNNSRKKNTKSVRFNHIFSHFFQKLRKKNQTCERNDGIVYVRTRSESVSRVVHQQIGSIWNKKPFYPKIEDRQQNLKRIKPKKNWQRKFKKKKCSGT